MATPSAVTGTVTLAHLSTAGLWQSTEAISASGFSTPGGSVAISDVDGYPACGTNGPVPVHFGPVRGPSPTPGSRPARTSPSAPT
ncbi:hypothetical protein ACFQ2M_41410 [Kitasatospora saccharophila]|uniref:hypothetical protein n=1 Tax=Kitasatospora saccharophila TaxID=407973 RepID=UPI00363A8EB4